MEQLTKNQAVATSQEAVQNQNEPQLRDENAHNDKSVHGVLNPTYQAGLRSEERRVGKECRSRWSPHLYKKKRFRAPPDAGSRVRSKIVNRFYRSSAFSFNCFLFCFQADDGIRDDRVTGVQTCALPILSIIGGLVVKLGSRMIDSSLRTKLNSIKRSEERRVGKECRSRWSRYH